MSQNILKIADFGKRPQQKNKKKRTTHQILAMLFAHSARAKRAYEPKTKIRISVLDQDGNQAVKIRL